MPKVDPNKVQSVQGLSRWHSATRPLLGTWQEVALKGSWIRALGHKTDLGQGNIVTSCTSKARRFSLHLKTDESEVRQVYMLHPPRYLLWRSYA